MSLGVAAALADGGLAQDVVVPAACATLDGTAGGALAGLTARFRMQILFEPTFLGNMVGREITALVFRRDGQDRRAMTGGRSSMIVRLSTVSAPPSRAAASFAANEGVDVSEVFRGVITIPDAPALGDRNGALWQPQHTVVVPFQSSFRYDGNTLCIDVEGEPVSGFASPWWRIDYDIWTHDGTSTSFGRACDGRSHAFASANTLVPGGSVRLMGSGPSPSAAVALIGAERLPSPLPLGFLGAPHCTLEIRPAIAVGADFGGLARSGYGVGALELQLPTHRELAGAMLYAQWAAFPAAQNPNSLSTTDALELRVASLPMPPRSVTVRTGPVAAGALIPPYGRVLPHLAPVVCLRTR